MLLVSRAATHSVEVSTALSAEQSEIIGRYFRSRRPRMVARARRLMRRYSVVSRNSYTNI